VWESMDTFDRGVFVLLGLMLAHVVFITSERLYRYWVARRQSRAFVANAALQTNDISEVVRVANLFPKSHVATIVSAGFTEFLSGRSRHESINLAHNAMGRAHSTTLANLKLGVSTISSIAATAPFIGLFGTVLGILDAFSGGATQKTVFMMFVARSLAQALMATAMGLLVAIPAVWCRDFLQARVENFSSEMSNASSETLTFLAHVVSSGTAFETGTVGNLFEVNTVADVRAWEASYDRQRVLMPAICLPIIYIVFLMLYATAWSAASWYSYHYSEVRELTERQSVGGREAVSPDGRYRAIVPVIYRSRRPISQSAEGLPHWSCEHKPSVALRIVQNYPPPTWELRKCVDYVDYVLPRDEALSSWNCSAPTIMWRTNDELLLRCDDCSAEDLRFVAEERLPRSVTILGPGGRVIRPKMLPPKSPCD
jgi:biopolymer transport protein ExbB/TolQ